MRATLLVCAAGFALWFAALPRASAAEPMFTEMDLFVSGHDNVNIYRIPSLITVPSGAILTFIEAREGDDGDPTDLTLKRSPYVAPQPPRMLNGYPRVFGYGQRRRQDVVGGAHDPAGARSLFEHSIFERRHARRPLRDRQGAPVREDRLCTFQHGVDHRAVGPVAVQRQPKQKRTSKCCSY